MPPDPGIRNYIDQLRQADRQALADLRIYVDKLSELNAKAVVIASIDVDRRLDAMNRLREQIEAERGQYLRLDSYEERHAPLENRLNVLEQWRANLAGRTVALTSAVGITTATIGAVFGHFIH